MTDEQYEARIKEISEDLFKITDFPDDLFEEYVKRQKAIPNQHNPTSIDWTQELRLRLYRKGYENIYLVPSEDYVGFYVLDLSNARKLPYNVAKEGVDKIIEYLGLEVLK